MTDRIDNLQRDVEQRMTLLADLASPAPSEQAMARVRGAVLAEAARVRDAQRRLALLRPWVGVAAALLLAAGWTFRSAPDSPDWQNAAHADGAALDDWVEALDTSDAQVSAVFEELWLPIDMSDADAGMDDALDAFDSSLDALRVGA